MSKIIYSVLLSFLIASQAFAATGVISASDALAADVVSTATGKGVALVGYKAVAVGAYARTIMDKVGETVSIADFGAIPNDGLDDSVAIQAAIDAGAASGARQIFIPHGTYDVAKTIVLTNYKGITLFGEFNPVGAEIGHGSYLRYTATTGSLISIDSGSGITIEKLRLGYNNIAYAGDLVKTNNSGGLDCVSISIKDNFFTGEGLAKGAASLLRIEKTLVSNVTNNTFSSAQRGLVLYGYANIITIRGNLFYALLVSNSYLATGLAQTIGFYENTFEPLVNGRASGFDMAENQTVQNFNYVGNWHGDVGAAEGVWLNLRASGGMISGNIFGTAGTGAADYAITLTSSFGLSITGNRFVGQAIKYLTACGGLTITGNDIPSSTAFGGLNFIDKQASVFGNTGQPGLPRSKAYLSSNQLIATAVHTAISLDGNIYDVQSVHSAKIKNTRFTVPVGQGGLWQINASMTLNTATSGMYFLRVLKNGSIVIAEKQAPLNATIQIKDQVQALDVASGGDYYEVTVFQNSGKDLNVIGNSYALVDTSASAHRLFTGD